jgi:hypothetical protein
VQTWHEQSSQNPYSGSLACSSAGVIAADTERDDSFACTERRPRRTRGRDGTARPLDAPPGASYDAARLLLAGCSRARRAGARTGRRPSLLRGPSPLAGTRATCRSSQAAEAPAGGPAACAGDHTAGHDFPRDRDCAHARRSPDPTGADPKRAPLRAQGARSGPTRGQADDFDSGPRPAGSSPGSHEGSARADAYCSARA